MAGALSQGRNNRSPFSFRLSIQPDIEHPLARMRQNSRD
jgi:hypothetical protein